MHHKKAKEKRGNCLNKRKLAEQEIQKDQEAVEQKLQRFVLFPFAAVKPYIRLCVTANQKDLPEGTIGRIVPHTNLFEYYRVFFNGKYGAATVTITESDRQRWGVELTDIIQMARDNTAKYAQLKRVSEIIAHCEHISAEDVEDVEDVYSLFVQKSFSAFGAGAILLPKEQNPLTSLNRALWMVPVSRNLWFAYPTEKYIAKDLYEVIRITNHSRAESKNPKAAENNLCDAVFLYDPAKTNPFCQIFPKLN